MKDMEGYIIYILLAYIIYRDIIYDHRLNKLLNRIMAKNYEEFQYYDKKYETDLKEVKALRDEAREERIEDIQQGLDEAENKEATRVINAFDEDWGESEVDKTKVADLIR